MVEWYWLILFVCAAFCAGFAAAVLGVQQGIESGEIRIPHLQQGHAVKPPRGGVKGSFPTPAAWCDQYRAAVRCASCREWFGTPALVGADLDGQTCPVCRPETHTLGEKYA